MTLFARDDQIRMAAFKWLEEQSVVYDDVLPRKLLEQGFNYRGERITLVGPRGIWKPRSMTLPISITSIVDGPYEDRMDGDNFLHYSFRGTDPHHPDNAGLRELMRQQIPLIYFFNIEKGKYVFSWPAYIQSEDRAGLAFTVALDSAASINNKEPYNIAEEPEMDFGRRAYITAELKIRVHQRSFREKVMRAYREQCSLCQLRHPELLDAAHIIADNEEMGHPVINNGIALCKIHHAAFDRNILGIDPDYTVHIRQDILEEIDGPMLKYGIQSLQGQHILLPNKKIEHPDQERLEIRYGQFLEVE